MSSSEDEDAPQKTTLDHESEISDVTKTTFKIPKSKSVGRNDDDGIARRVFIAHKSIPKGDWNYIKAMMLPHPKTQSDALFLFDTREIVEENDTTHFIYEVLTMTEEHGLSSWFLGNCVSSHGNLYIFTPMDPLYVILPAIAKSTHGRPLMDHLIDFYPMKFANVLNRRVDSHQLLNISIKKVNQDIEAYVFDLEKALEWLKKKVNAVATYFAERGLTNSESSISSNFTLASRSATDDTRQEHTLYACDLVCEYLNDSLTVKLRHVLGIPADQERERLKRKITDIEEKSKRLKLENGEVSIPLEDYGSALGDVKATPKGPGTAKQKQLQQAAKGSHSLLKFFSPKPKTK